MICYKDTPSIMGTQQDIISVCVPETLQAFNRLASSGSAFVRTVELQLQCKGNEHNEHAGNQRSCDAGMIGRLVLLAEHGAANDAANTTCSDKGGGGQCTLPLATDVVGLES